MNAGHPLSPELTSHIHVSAARGYEIIAREQGEPAEVAHTKPWCRGMTTTMVLALFEIGETPQVNARGGRLDEHRYVTIGDDDLQIVIDPTWQQFLPPDRLTPELPKILIGTRPEVMRFAQEAGVLSDDALVWSADHVVPPHRTPVERIAAAIDATT